MNIDDLIGLADGNGGDDDANKLWCPGDADEDIGASVKHLVMRVTTSTSADLQVASFEELATIAQKAPAHVTHILSTAFSTAAKALPSPLCNAAFKFIYCLIARSESDGPDSDDGRVRAQALHAALHEVPASLNLALSAAGTLSRQAPVLPSPLDVAGKAGAPAPRSNYATLFLIEVLTNPASAGAVAQALRGRGEDVPGLSLDQPLAPFLLQILRTSQPSSQDFALVDLFLSVEGATDVFASVSEDPGAQPSQPSQSSQPPPPQARTMLLTACMAGGLLDALLTAVEVDQASSSLSVSAMGLLSNAVSVYGPGDAATRAYVDATFASTDTVARLGNILHSCAYAVVTALSQGSQIGGAVVPILRAALGIVYALNDGKGPPPDAAQDPYVNSKVFDYSVMLLCTPDAQHLADPAIYDLALAAARVLLAVARSETTLRRLSVTVTLSLTPGGTGRVDVLSRLCRLLCAELLEDGNAEFSAVVHRLLHAMLSIDDVALGFAAALSKPVRAVYRNSWKEGLKVLIKSFSLRIPDSSQAKDIKDGAFADYADGWAKRYRDTVDHGLQGPVLEIAHEAPHTLVSYLTAADARCPRNLVYAADLLQTTIQGRVQPCLHVLCAGVTCPANAYEIVPNVATSLFQTAATFVFAGVRFHTSMALLYAMFETVGAAKVFGFLAVPYLRNPEAVVRGLSILIDALLSGPADAYTGRGALGAPFLAAVPEAVWRILGRGVFLGDLGAPDAAETLAGKARALSGALEEHLVQLSLMESPADFIEEAVTGANVDIAVLTTMVHAALESIRQSVDEVVEAARRVEAACCSQGATPLATPGSPAPSSVATAQSDAVSPAAYAELLEKYNAALAEIASLRAQLGQQEPQGQQPPSPPPPPPQAQAQGQAGDLAPEQPAGHQNGRRRNKGPARLSQANNPPAPAPEHQDAVAEAPAEPVPCDEHQ